MKQNKKTVPVELSYYGLYLLDYLRKYHPDKASDTVSLPDARKQPPPTFEKERLAGGTVEDATRKPCACCSQGCTSLPTPC